MIKQLRKVGNSNALLLDKPLLELVGLEENASVEITVDHGNIIISPVSPGTISEDRAQELLCLAPIDDLFRIDNRSMR